jgi:hypothetical protein
MKKMTKKKILAQVSRINLRPDNLHLMICHVCVGMDCQMCKEVPTYNNFKNFESVCELFCLKFRDKEKAIQIIKDSIEADKKLEYMENLK